MFFSDIIGQQIIKNRLLHAASEGRVAHAQLFLGKRGVGKLPMALAFARYLCCEHPLPDDACGVCPSCVKFAALAHPDLHFVFPIIKKDKNKTTVCDEFVGQFREAVLANPYLTPAQWQNIVSGDKQMMIYTSESAEILRKLNLKVYEAPYKIIIIWCPEKMNEECANKLLKILEEPLGQTVFLLVSDAPETLLPTIVSRTQQLRFPPIDTDSMALAVSKYYPDCDASEQARLVSQAGGSWSDLLVAVDRLEDTGRYFEQFVSMMRLAWTRDIGEIRAWVDTMQTFGRSGQIQFLSLAQQALRDNFILRIKQPNLVTQNSQEKDFSEKFAPFIHEGNVRALMDALALAEVHIGQNANGRILFFDLILQINYLIKANTK
jgi:DNA polymerase-3 subunit delta'